jgi:hypothetical protein
MPKVVAILLANKPAQADDPGSALDTMPSGLNVAAGRLAQFAWR